MSPFRLVDADERDDLFDMDEEELDLIDISSVGWWLLSTVSVGIEVLREDGLSQFLDNKALWSGVDADGISKAREDDESTLSRCAENDVD